MVAFAFGGRAQRSEIGTSAGLGVTLAPPVFTTENAWQEALLLFIAAKRHDHGGDHAQPEIQLAGRAGEGTFFLEDNLLNRIPAGATKFFRPGGRTPALIKQNLLPAF